MAKAKRRKPRATRKPKSARQAKQVAQELQEFYQLGLDVLAADQKNPRKGKYSLGVSVEFATMSEFKELSTLNRSEGTPLGPRHVIGLLRIKNKRKRKQFQRKAVRESWSTRRIAGEVSKLLGAAGSGGRQAKAPADVDDAMAQIITMSNRWSRWFEGFTPKKRQEKGLEKSRIEVDDLPDSVGKLVKSVTGQIQKLKKAVEEELKLAAQQAKKR